MQGLDKSLYEEFMRRAECTCSLIPVIRYYSLYQEGYDERDEKQPVFRFAKLDFEKLKTEEKAAKEMAKKIRHSLNSSQEFCFRDSTGVSNHFLAMASPQASLKISIFRSRLLLCVKLKNN